MSVTLAPPPMDTVGTAEDIQPVDPTGSPLDRDAAVGLYEVWVLLPSRPPPPPAPPGVRAMVREVLDRTGWSTRELGELLGVSHTTVQHWSTGRVPRTWQRERTVTAVEALQEIHRVLQRLTVLAGDDPRLLARLLKTAAPGAADSVYALLRRGDFAGAYLAALDALRPAPSTGPTGLLVGDQRRAARPGRSVVSLDDD